MPSLSKPHSSRSVSLSLAISSAARGELAAVKIGDRSLIKIESIDKFVASRPAAKVVMPATQARAASVSDEAEHLLTPAAIRRWPFWLRSDQSDNAAHALLKGKVG